MDNTAQPPNPIVTNFPLREITYCLGTQVHSEDWSLTDRQQRLPWWNQDKTRRAGALIVGTGGIGGNLGKIFAQMGFWFLTFIDHDLVADSNRNRQLFTADDVGRPKAHRVLHNLKPYATNSATLDGYYTTFEDWVELGDSSRYQVICCGVDSIPTMVAVARHGIEKRIPVIFINVSPDGEACRVFIQRPGPAHACFACYRPDLVDYRVRRDQRCTPVPAIADILQVSVGFGARAAVGEVLHVPIGDYNCRDITFSGIDLKKTVQVRRGCPLCRERMVVVSLPDAGSEEIAVRVGPEDTAGTLLGKLGYDWRSWHLAELRDAEPTKWYEAGEFVASDMRGWRLFVSRWRPCGEVSA